jgi:hypothetical protein
MSILNYINIFTINMSESLFLQMCEEVDIQHIKYYYEQIKNNSKIKTILIKGFIISCTKCNVDLINWFLNLTEYNIYDIMLFKKNHILY